MHQRQLARKYSIDRPLVNPYIRNEYRQPLKRTFKAVHAQWIQLIH